MKVEFLKKEKVDSFLAYCLKHRSVIDESFLYDEDLEAFEPNDENPTYIISNKQGEIVGTASLIVDDYSKRGRKARFRIFHSELENVESYNMLLKAILDHTEGIDRIFVFVPVVNNRLVKCTEGLDFTVERHACLLVRDKLDLPNFSIPEDYDIRAFIEGKDEEIWCEVRNASFAKLQGSETPITPKMVTKMMSAKDNLKGGSMILYHKNRPVGVIRGEDDEYENAPIMNIGPIAVLPEFQGRGLGRILLRAALRFGKEQGYDKSILCVNADNDKAKALYIQEGFQQVEAVTCYTYDVV